MAGLAFVPLLGVEADEALTGEAIYNPRGELWAIKIGHTHIPIMLMSYLGAFKAWLQRPIFHLFGPTVMTLRVPMLLAGAASLVLFFVFLRRLAGERAALIGCALLAVDSNYLLTSVFDWGPVALQHLLLLAGMYLLLRFHQERRDWALAGGMALLGLTLWDKALAAWMISGMGIALLVTAPRQVFAAWTRRRFGISVAAFVIGASPLLVYNAKNHWETARGTYHKDFGNLSGKAQMLANTARGNGLFDWMVSMDWKTPQPHAPSGVLQRASAEISALAGRPTHHLIYEAFFLALAAAPFAGWPALRGVLFALIAGMLAWIQMAITANAGGSVHHTILLWPLPQMVIALAFAGASRRMGRAGIPALAAVMAVVLGSGLLVINEYYVDAFRNGGGPAWNPAIFRLAGHMKKADYGYLYCMDWNLLDPLRLLGSGKFRIGVGSDQVMQPVMTPADRRFVIEAISNPKNLFVGHTKEFQVFPEFSARMDQFAAGEGYGREMVAVFGDGFGRPVIELYRFRRTCGGGAGGCGAEARVQTGGK